MTIVILDNRDSFVLNVQHRLAELDVPSVVLPAHATRLDQIEAVEPKGLIVSPGPQGPEEAGVSTAAIRAFGMRIPVLGVCLGHQCIAVAYGARVRPNRNACHGRAALVANDGQGVLTGLPPSFMAARYHALAVDTFSNSAGDDSPLIVTATLVDDETMIMGLRHRYLPTEGVQFHPESVLTPHGYRIIGNFARQSGYRVDDDLVDRRIDKALAVVEGRH